MYRKVKLELENTNVPIIRYALDDRSVHWAIVDTGAQFSVLDKSLRADKNNRIKCNMVTVSSEEGQEVYGASKNILFNDIDGNEIRCQINGFEMELLNMADAVKAQLRDKIKIDMIIGIKDLIHYQCKLDLKNGYLLIQEKA